MSPEFRNLIQVNQAQNLLPYDRCQATGTFSSAEVASWYVLVLTGLPDANPQWAVTVPIGGAIASGEVPTQMPDVGPSSSWRILDHNTTVGAKQFYPRRLGKYPFSGAAGGVKFWFYFPPFGQTHVIGSKSTIQDPDAEELWPLKRPYGMRGSPMTSIEVRATQVFFPTRPPWTEKLDNIGISTIDQEWMALTCPQGWTFSHLSLCGPTAIAVDLFFKSAQQFTRAQYDNLWIGTILPLMAANPTQSRFDVDQAVKIRLGIHARKGHVPRYYLFWHGYV